MDCLYLSRLSMLFTEPYEFWLLAFSKDFPSIIVFPCDVFEACIARADKQGRSFSFFRQEDAGCHVDFAVYSKQKGFS